MTIWLTADHHFGHTNIIKYCGRPFPDVETMDAEMIARWNSVVAPDDVVYHLGDFALTCKEKCKEYRSLLNGVVHLVKGNHDRHSVRYYLDCGFATVQTSIVLEHGVSDVLGALLTHKQGAIDLGRWINFHGHVHHAWKFDAMGRMNVGVDVCNFTPISLEDALFQYSNYFFSGDFLAEEE